MSACHCEVNEMSRGNLFGSKYGLLRFARNDDRYHLLTFYKRS